MPGPHPAKGESWGGNALLLGILLLISLVLYQRMIPVPLSSDARFLTYQNEFVTDPGGLAKIWNADMFEGAQTYGLTYRSGYYRPVLNAQLWLEYRWAGSRDALYNLSEILLHGLVAFLVALLVGRVARDRGAGILAGLLFVAHPVHAFVATEPAARGDLLFVIFYLGALLVFDRSLVRSREGHLPWGSLAATAALYLASLLSKEMGVTLPAVLVALVFLRAAQGEASRRRVLWTLPAWGCLGAYLIWRFGVLGLYPSQMGYTAAHEKAELLLAALKAIPIHLSRILMPLEPGYPELNPWLINTVGTGLADPLVWVALAVVGALAACALFLWRRSPVLAFWSAFFLISFSPLIRIENIGGTLNTNVMLTQERWIYLPAVAVLGAVASAAIAWVRSRGLETRRAPRMMLAAAGAMVIIGLAVMASEHAGKAEDPFARLRRLYSLPDELLSRFEQANRLLLYAHFVSVPRGELPDAARRAREALELVPDSPLSAMSAAEIFALQGRWQEVVDLLEPWISPDQAWLEERAATNQRVFDDWNRVNPQVMLLMGRALAHVGRSSEAVPYLCEARRRQVSQEVWSRAVREAPGLPTPLRCEAPAG